jgi:hypothetical protein
MEPTEPAATVALLASGVFFLTGLITGVWKYRCMWTSENTQAPYYVNTAHRASLLYSFASLVLYHFALVSIWSATVDLVAVVVPVFFFGFAITTYVVHGLLRDTDNQFEKPHILGPFELPSFAIRGAMWLLIIGEVGGFGVLFAGFVVRLL